MRIAIIGGGAAGIYSALLIKQDHPSFDVHIFEKEKKLGRKLCATGNGRCNLLNADLTPEKYNHPDVMKGVLDAYPFSYLCSVIKSFGIPLHDENGYLYPESNNAVSYTDFLVDLLRQFKVGIHLETEVTDYEQKAGKFRIVTLNCMDFGLFDKVILTVGGCSTPNLGSDGRTFPVLEKHGYQIVPLRPGLCPIKIKNQKTIKGLSGLRRKALVTATVSSRQVFQETGEVLFKEDGLSGIVIFNLESALTRLGVLPQSEIHLGLLPDESVEDLFGDLVAFHKMNPENFLSGFFPEALSSYIYKINKLDNRQLSDSDLRTLSRSIKDLVFLPESSYSFENSQVTLGGVSFSEVGPGLESKKEKGLFFAGEVLDLDGLCGGYNLTWALLSALIVSEALPE